MKMFKESYYSMNPLKIIEGIHTIGKN